MEIFIVEMWAIMYNGQRYHVNTCEEGDNGTFNYVDGPDYQAFNAAVLAGQSVDRWENRQVSSYFV